MQYPPKKIMHPPKKMSSSSEMSYQNNKPVIYTQPEKEMMMYNNPPKQMSSNEMSSYQNNNYKVHKQQAAVLPDIIDMKASPLANPPEGSYVPAHIAGISAGKGNRHGIAAAAVRRRPNKKQRMRSSKKVKKPLAGKAMMAYKRRQKNPYAYGRRR